MRFAIARVLYSVDGHGAKLCLCPLVVRVQILSSVNESVVAVTFLCLQGLALLHWSCDRGHENIVDVLLNHGANINVQVSLYVNTARNQ